MRVGIGFPAPLGDLAHDAMKWSSDSFDSVSVGSIISASGTTSGK